MSSADVVQRPIVEWQLPRQYAEFAMRQLEPNQLSLAVCKQMSEGYLLHKGDAASNKEFVEEVEKLLLYLKCTCKEHVFCSLCDCVSLTFGFQEILRLRLSLTVALFADAAHRNSRFTTWASARPSDILFGSMGNAALVKSLQQWQKSSGIECCIEATNTLAPADNILSQWWLRTRPHRHQNEGRLNWFDIDEVVTDEPRVPSCATIPKRLRSDLMRFQAMTSSSGHWDCSRRR